MKVICAGMRRSGSTWVYNLLRLGMGVEGCFEDRVGTNATEVDLVKIHRFSIHLLWASDRVVTSYRDLRDVASSAVLRELVENETQAIIKYLFREVDEYSRWAKRADYEMRYEDMFADPVGEAQKILKIVNVNKGKAKRLCTKVRRFRPGAVENRKTLLHPNHFTKKRPGHYKGTLSSATVAAIEVVFSNYFTRYNYQL